mmetsp:Transcript_62708/g.148513  ORF Transcript_62708/g.148513 Transcript_62708/m.148513 type:complete len:230 (+) Transcript_62708:59-748(+)|eukprot:CAMPEP_0175954472 /NCGR_PEP_ID=MMETSP0108-20121206/31938_1 /TAXON_ID=195067 ORGANISM="Goniomonas pacifica, Strain CCMP1869" /NCGR_SAMPLE_ID=MMETSP0108 /ASSEMBLY_ACC=CAM_ASM_000204 /LENGTH=229 /DNA_ID=CAMNT_0017281173 /DNA_START=25 /DNA_END=714 /DNA_ORIENTATION=+
MTTLPLDAQHIAQKLSEKLRVDDVEGFLEIYDAIPAHFDEDAIEEIKEVARKIQEGTLTLDFTDQATTQEISLPNAEAGTVAEEETVAVVDPEATPKAASEPLLSKNKQITAADHNSAPQSRPSRRSRHRKIKREAMRAALALSDPDSTAKAMADDTNKVGVPTGQPSCGEGNDGVHAHAPTKGGRLRANIQRGAHRQEQVCTAEDPGRKDMLAKWLAVIADPDVVYTS